MVDVKSNYLPSLAPDCNDHHLLQSKRKKLPVVLDIICVEFVCMHARYRVNDVKQMWNCIEGIKTNRHFFGCLNTQRQRHITLFLHIETNPCSWWSCHKSLWRCVPDEQCVWLLCFPQQQQVSVCAPTATSAGLRTVSGTHLEIGHAYYSLPDRFWLCSQVFLLSQMYNHFLFTFCTHTWLNVAVITDDSSPAGVYG